MPLPCPAVLAILLPAALAQADGALVPTDLEAWIDASEAAFGQGDETGFSAACGALPAQVGRLSEPLSPAQAARVHAFMALCSYSSQANRPGVTEEDLQNAVTPYVRAARHADPKAGLGARARQDAASPLTRWFAASIRDPAPGPTFPDVGWGRILVDGREARSFSSDTPGVVQRACGEGPFGPSRYLQAGAAVPDWERCPLKPGTARHVGLAVGTGVAALLTMGMEVGAATTYSAFLAPDTPPEDLDALWTRNRVYASGVWVAGALTLGLGTTLIVTW